MPHIVDWNPLCFWGALWDFGEVASLIEVLLTIKKKKKRNILLVNALFMAILLDGTYWCVTAASLVSYQSCLVIVVMWKNAIAGCVNMNVKYNLQGNINTTFHKLSLSDFFLFLFFFLIHSCLIKAIRNIYRLEERSWWSEEFGPLQMILSSCFITAWTSAGRKWKTKS